GDAGGEEKNLRERAAPTAGAIPLPVAPKVSNSWPSRLRQSELREAAKGRGGDHANPILKTMELEGAGSAPSCLMWGDTELISMSMIGGKGLGSITQPGSGEG
ncbi:unnamed protein product, partial [Discosporangium mesarthrocarpum]